LCALGLIIHGPYLSYLKGINPHGSKPDPDKVNSSNIFFYKIPIITLVFEPFQPLWWIIVLVYFSPITYNTDNRMEGRYQKRQMFSLKYHEYGF
jgi:hypothetical protein